MGGVVEVAAEEEEPLVSRDGAEAADEHGAQAADGLVLGVDEDVGLDRLRAQVAEVVDHQRRLELGHERAALLHAAVGAEGREERVDPGPCRAGDCALRDWRRRGEGGDGCGGGGGGRGIGAAAAAGGGGGVGGGCLFGGLVAGLVVSEDVALDCVVQALERRSACEPGEGHGGWWFADIGEERGETQRMGLYRARFTACSYKETLRT